MDVIIKRNDRLTAGPCSKTTGEEVRSRSVVRLEKQTRCLSTRRVAHILNKRELFQVKSSQFKSSLANYRRLSMVGYDRFRTFDFRLLTRELSAFAPLLLSVPVWLTSALDGDFRALFRL